MDLPRTIGGLRDLVAAATIKIAEIQEQCSHPEAVVTRVNRGSTGNYDPSADGYWVECECGLCGKRWCEDQ
jgi:hypothetical protein